MSRTLAMTAVGWLACMAGVSAAEPMRPEEAGAVFQKSCRACHQVPDPRFATDRAWLDQINRTS